MGSSVVTFGPIDDNVRAQIDACVASEPGARAVLCADNHLGYSMPIGGVVAYRHHVSPSAVGYDIGCGNMAVKTTVPVPQSARTLEQIMDEVFQAISFGVGRKNAERAYDPVLDDIATVDDPFVRGLQRLAEDQLGTVGSGNHYVDLFAGSDGLLWVGVHFGSRGFGHKIATEALRRAGVTDTSMMAPPVLIPTDSPLGEWYVGAMCLAGRYASAGRRWVVDRVVSILGGLTLDIVHNHHNFAWSEAHDGESWWVHRKGATPAFPGQTGFVGGSMMDDAVILEGVQSDAAQQALYSTVHGAGRAMSRSQALGKTHRKTGEVLRPGLVNFSEVQQAMRDRGIVLRGAGADEAPQCYKRLPEVLAHHAGTVRVLEALTPVGVAMAGKDVTDPYKD